MKQKGDKIHKKYIHGQKKRVSRSKNKEHKHCLGFLLGCYFAPSIKKDKNRDKNENEEHWHPWSDRLMNYPLVSIKVLRHFFQTLQAVGIFCLLLGGGYFVGSVVPKKSLTALNPLISCLLCLSWACD